MRYHILSAAFGLAAFGLATGPADALTMKECSTKYQAAKMAGATTKWNDFRKAECGTDAAATTGAAAPPAATVTRTAAPSTPAAPKPAATPSVSGSLSYPSAVDPKYATESAGKARMHTCLDSYNAAKAAGSLGETKWIMKGGGYYSACNTKLKG